MEQVERKTRDHGYYFRLPKPCIKCHEETNMPSSSYCKGCMRTYVNQLRIKRNELRESVRENFINKS